MSLNKLIIVFGVILVIFAGVVFFQFSSNSAKKTLSKTQANTVTINNHTFKVEPVTTSEKQQLGLSGRESLAQDQGMLFVFEESDYHTFWMKNMKFPIDIIFINEDDEIVSIAENAKPPASDNETLPLYKSGGPVNTVLEINAGLSEKYDIQVGDKVEINLK